MKNRRKQCLFLAVLLLLTFLLTACTKTEEEIAYCGSRKSNVFHYTTCRYVSQINTENYVTYSSRDAAIDRGKRPCKVCKP